MAGHPLIIEFDEFTMARVKIAAAAAGLSVEAYVLEKATAALPAVGVAEAVAAFDSPGDWTEANRRLAEYDRTGVSIPLEEVLGDVRADLETRLASKA